MKRAKGLIPVGKVWQAISGGKGGKKEGKGGGGDGDELVDVGR